jgi:hypothetical protein
LEFWKTQHSNTPSFRFGMLVTDAVNGYFEPAERPARVRLHFVQDPVVSVA